MGRKKMKIAKDLTELIGHTPLVELSAYGKRHGLVGRIVAKAETLNLAPHKPLSIHLKSRSERGLY